MSVVFKELGGSPREVFEPQAMRAQRRLLVAWEERHALVGQLLLSALRPNFRRSGEEYLAGCVGEYDRPLVTAFGNNVLAFSSFPLKLDQTFPDGLALGYQRGPFRYFDSANLFAHIFTI